MKVSTNYKQSKLLLMRFIDTVISCCPQVWDSWKEHVYGSDDNTGEKLPLLPDHEDERSIRNLVLRYIESSQGSSIKSVYDLANVIVDSCGMVFDQYQVSQSFQFMDFFERSIGKVVSFIQLPSKNSANSDVP